MATVQFSTSRRVMSRVERWIGQHIGAIWFVIAVYLLLYALYDYFVLSGRSHFIDWLYISTIVVFAVGAYLAMDIPTRMTRTFARLANRGTLDIAPDQLDTLRQQLEKNGARAAQIGSAVGALGAIVTIVLADYYGPPQFVGYSLRYLVNQLALGGINAIDALGVLTFLPSLVFIGYFVGYYIGYMIGNGRFGHFLQRHHIAVKVQPGHPDGAAGLSLIGTLYLFQAALVAIPALFCAIWLLLMRNVDTFSLAYSALWYTPYTFLFVAFLVAEIVAFVAPMWSIHRAMAAQKQVLLRDTDKLSKRIITLQERIVEAETPEEAGEFSRQLMALTSYYRAVQDMPTWPVDGGTLRRFTIGNLGLVLSVGAQPILHQLSSWLQLP